MNSPVKIFSLSNHEGNCIIIMNKFKITSKVTQTPRMTYLRLRYIISPTTPTSIVSSVVKTSGIMFSCPVIEISGIRKWAHPHFKHTEREALESSALPTF